MELINFIFALLISSCAALALNVDRADPRIAQIHQEKSLLVNDRSRSGFNVLDEKFGNRYAKLVTNYVDREAAPPQEARGNLLRNANSASRVETFGGRPENKYHKLASDRAEPRRSLLV